MSRAIKLLQLTGSVTFKGSPGNRLHDIAPEEYQEDERGLFLFDRDVDVYVPWTSILAVSYARPTTLAKEIQKALPATLDTFLERAQEAAAPTPLEPLAARAPVSKPAKKKGAKDA